MKSIKRSIGSRKGAAITKTKKMFAGDCSQRIKRPKRNYGR